MKYGEFKFSSYPWRVSSPNKNFGPKVWGADDRMVADCGNIHNRTEEEEAANAQLIAYAPEMLEMLQSCLSFVEELKHQGIDNWSDEGKLRSLIKKATTI